MVSDYLHRKAILRRSRYLSAVLGLVGVDFLVRCLSIGYMPLQLLRGALLAMHPPRRPAHQSPTCILQVLGVMTQLPHNHKGACHLKMAFVFLLAGVSGIAHQTIPANPVVVVAHSVVGEQVLVPALALSSLSFPRSLKTPTA